MVDLSGSGISNLQPRKHGSLLRQHRPVEVDLEETIKDLPLPLLVACPVWRVPVVHF